MCNVKDCCRCSGNPKSTNLCEDCYYDLEYQKHIEEMDAMDDLRSFDFDSGFYKN